jgi:hypothetical protein
LNGTDISSARSQELKGVDLVINDKGDIFINAPNYQVNDEDTYVPLSKFVQGMNVPKHQPMQRVGPGQNVGAVEKMPEEAVRPLAKEETAPETAQNAAIPKAGSPVPAGALPIAAPKDEEAEAPPQAEPAKAAAQPPAN